MVKTSGKFSYYTGLTKKQKTIYDKSDRITEIRLPQPDRFKMVVPDLAKALSRDNKKETKEASERLLKGLCTVFKVSPVAIKILSRRPSKSWGELHGLYVSEEGKKTIITVWMKTAKRKKVVAFKTFLRTLIHEFIHHLDFDYLKLRYSFHTVGFYKRESSLLRQLMQFYNNPY